MREAEVDGNRCDDFHGFPAEKRRFVFPRAHRFNHTLPQQRIAFGYDLQVLYVPILGNDGLQYYSPFHTSHPRQRRVFRARMKQRIARDRTFTDSNRTFRSRCG